MIVRQPEERFPTAPEGSYAAVCVDEIDLGKVKSSFGGEETERNMVRLVWQIDEEMTDAECQRHNVPEGTRYTIKQDYTASLHEKAKLRQHLQSWRGRAFTQTELFGFDLESVVGQPCMLSIIHVQGRKGGTFSNLESVMRPPKGMAAIIPVEYVRVKDRPATAPAKKNSAPEEAPPTPNWSPADEDVPF